MPLIETKIDKFDGGIENDPRDPRENTCRMVSNFDIFTNSKKMTPYRHSVSGDTAASTSRKQNFTIALRTGTTYSVYALGVVSADDRAEILYQDLGSLQSAADTWSATTNNQQPDTTGATNFNLFVYYQRTDRIYGARNGSHIWSYEPGGELPLAIRNKQ